MGYTRRSEPTNPDAERRVLAALLIAASMGNQTAFVERLLRSLRPEHFFREWHQAVFRLFADRWQAGEPCGLASICAAQPSARESADVVALLQSAAWATGAVGQAAPPPFLAAEKAAAVLRVLAQRRETPAGAVGVAYREVPE